MAFMITDRCINCGYCEQECPNEAIYKPGMKWTMSDGTLLTGIITLRHGREVDAKTSLEPLSEEFYFVVPDKCTECKGVHDNPQCLEVCPNPESIIPHPQYDEKISELLVKQYQLNI